MNNNDEIMKEFNETFGTKPEVSVEPYHATTNQNTTIQQPVNNINDTNIQNNNVDNVMPNLVNQNPSVNIIPELNNNVNNNININPQENIQNNPQQLYNTSNQINNNQVQKKAKKATLKINPELKTVVLLALALLIAMAFIPTLFDLIDNLKLKVFG